jgi:hypothetical protein
MFPATDGEYKEQQQPNFLCPTLSIISIEPPYYLFDFGRNRGTSFVVAYRKNRSILTYINRLSCLCLTQLPRSLSLSLCKSLAI